MAWTGDQKRAARAALTALYPDAARARGLLTAAGLDPTAFPFGGRALDVWAPLVDALAQRGRLCAVILQACAEHPDDAALHALHQAAAPAVHMTDPAPMYLSAAPGALRAGPSVSLRPSKRA